MVEQNASLKLGLIDDGFTKGVGDIATQLTNMQIGLTATGAGLPLLEKGLRSSASAFTVGAKNADDFARNMRKVISLNTELATVIGKASYIAFHAQQFTLLAKGASDAYTSLRRIPETLEQMQRSGVSTDSIQGFMSLRDAISGSQTAVESFAQVAVAKLNAVESASARVGTILRSSTEFTEAGTAKRATGKDLTQNRKQVQKLLREKLDNSVTTTEALLGQYEVLSGGFTSNKASQQVLEPGLKLIGIAGAGGQAVDPTATLQLLTKTLRAYGLEASQATRVSAILNGTVENGITTIQELSQTFGQAAQVAKTAGISIEDLAAATSVLTAQGTSTPVALTGIQALGRSIIDKTPEAAKELAKLRDSEGKRIRFDIREVQEKGLAKSIQDIFEATGGNQEKLAQILPDTLAYRTALGLNSNKGQDYKNVTASIKANANAQSLDEVAKTATDDRISRFQKIANRFEETIIQLGESLAPVFEPGLAYLEKLSKFIANIPDPVKKAIASYLVFKIQVNSTGIAFKQLMGAIVPVLTNFALLRVISLALSGQLGKQIGIIKDLIVQQKGYRSVIKQLIGIDQSYKLAVGETTEALAKQGVVQKTVNNVAQKTKNIIDKNIDGFIGQQNAIHGTGKAVDSVKSRFLRFTDAIRSTTAGKKVEELTEKFTGQKDALKGLAEETQKYFAGLKEAADQGIEKIKKTPSQMDRQVEVYAAKRRAEIEKTIPDSPDSFGGLLETDPEVQRETRRRELLAERDKRNGVRRQKKLQQQIIEKERLAAQQLIDLQSESLLAGVGAKTFGDSLDGEDIAFGDFAEKEKIDAETRRKKVLADIRYRKSQKQMGDKSIAGTFGEFAGIASTAPAISSGVPGDSFGTFMGANPEIDDSPKRPSRDDLRERARGRGFRSIDDRRRVVEARRLSGIDDKLSVWQAVGYVGEKATKTAVAGVKEGFGLITDLGGALLTKLGPIVPLGLAIGAAFAFAGKEITHLFGGGASNALSKGIETTLKALKDLEKETGKDGALLSFKSDLVALSEGNDLKADGLKPLGDRLAQLKDVGSLTSGQFTAMSNAMKQAGEDGRVTAQELSILQNQIEAIRAGAPGAIETGIIDKLKTTLSFEGLGRLTNFLGNTGVAAIKNIAMPLGEFDTAEGVNADREADRLIKPLSLLGQQSELVGNQALVSVEKTKQLTDGIFLTQEARDLATKGSQIQGVALEKENKVTDEVIKKNEILISGYQAQAEARSKLIEETTDPKLKQQLIDQFQLAETEVNNLQKRTEALKQAREQIIKYYNETLPVLQQAVASSSVDPADATGALNDAFSVYQEKYIDQGKKFLKDVQQQRTEGQAVLEQVLQNYDRNLLSSAEVADKTKEILEKSFISLTKDGKTIKGSVFDIDTQKQLINQIAQFSSQATTERLTQIDIESSAIVAAGQLRQASEESVIQSTTDLQQEKLDIRKKQLESEIVLRMQYGIKTTDLENQLKQVSLEIAQSEFNEKEKLIQKQLERKLQAFDTEKTLISSQVAGRSLSEENAQKQLSQIQINESKLKANEIKRQLDQYKANGVKSVELENQYAQARNQITEAEAKEKERLIQQSLQQKSQNFEIEKNQLQTLSEEGKLGQEDLISKSSEISLKQAKLKESDLARQVQQLRANGQVSVSVEQEYAQQRLQVRSLEAREQKRLLDLQLEQKTTALEIEKSTLSTQVTEGTIGGEDAQSKTVELTIAQAKLKEESLAKELKTLKDAGKTSVALENQYTQQRLQIRNLEAQEKKRLIELALQQQIQALNVEQSDIELKVSQRVVSERDAQTAISQNRIEQERLRVAELDRQLKVLKDNNGTSVSLEQEASIARSKLKKMEVDEQNRIEDLQFETFKKQLQNENQRSTLRQQNLEIEFDLLQKQSQLVESLTSSRNQTADAESRYIQSQLQNQAKLSRDPLQQAEIELRILGERQADLVRTQKAENESLATRQKLADIDLKRQQVQIQTQKLELESQSKILAIELQRAITQKRSPEEIEAIRLQIQGNDQREKSLNQQLSLTNQQISQQGEINSNELKRTRLSQQIESENLKIEKTLARQRVIHENIDKVTKAFVLTQQKLQQEYNKQTSVLEKQSTILGFQKELVEARQKALNDKMGFVNAEIGLASQLITNDKQRQVLAQNMALVKIKSLEEQQKAEREVLLINQAQAKIQQQIEAIKLKGQQAQSKAEVAQAQADLAKLRASGATQEEITAGEMGLEAKLQASQALDLQAKLQPLQAQLSDFGLEQELSGLDRKQRLDRLTAKSELASTMPEGRQQQKLKQQIINELMSGLFGKKVTDWNYTSVLDQIQRGDQSELNRLINGKDQGTMRGRSGSVYIDYGKPPEVQGLNVSSSLTDEILNKVLKLSEPTTPNLQMGTPSAPNLSLGPTEYTRFQQNAQNVENNVKMEIGGIKITVTSPGDAGKQMEQEILNTLDRVLIEAKRRP